MKYSEFKKKAAQVSLDLGDGYLAEYDDTDPKAKKYVSKVQELAKPKGFLNAANDSVPVALLAAAVGGVGSGILSGWDSRYIAAGAGISGLGTMLVNGLINRDSRNMSVEDAMLKAGQ